MAIHYKIANRDVVDSFQQGEQEDLKFSATRVRQGANLKPDYDYERIGLLFPENDETEIATDQSVMPHARKADTNIQPHVHIKQNQAGQPKFVMEYKWYNPNEAIPTTWSTIVLDTSEFAYSSGEIGNIVINGTDSFISGTGKGVASIFEFRLYRQTGDGYTGDVLVSEIDLHYYASQFGDDVI